ncbi:hypothetical protein G7059_08005 [Erysipelothrix sp. HDW6A]|uniref:hypothetical protein n=1 Tax=Erysipelothrix sp. HDW6A TaxID=2714928 RepID=UPI00140E2C8E|nr:hypothetical protein [Erysipelothrix sp. HDW6A]QIK57785.1 hypothetical protein G7059_08005 [Erysipelothrix sp. HDW6A]
MINLETSLNILVSLFVIIVVIGTVFAIVMVVYTLKTMKKRDERRYKCFYYRKVKKDE